MTSVVIVGASLAGYSAAKALRRRGFDGTITLVGDEPHPPYQRPPLSKHFLGGEWDRAKIDLRTPNDLALEWRLGISAQALDLQQRVVILARGYRLPFDELIIATGARARKPSWYTDMEGVFTLRTVDDSQALKSHLDSGKRKIAIVGAGFIGLETAATLTKLNCNVTLIDLDRLPMLRVLGEDLARVCLRLHESNGVRACLGVATIALVGSTRAEGVRLNDGAIIDADCVVVGVGVTPNVEWLEGSGLTLENGVVCDSTCAALGADRVYAAGDVANWKHPHYGQLRVEHWENAIAQGDAVAQSMLAPPGSARSYTPIPFFWSDQYDNKLQLIGVPRPTDALRVVEGGIAERRFVALFERDGRASAAFLLNSTHRAAIYRQQVEATVTGFAEGAAA